ncbi:hypothetical protein ACFWY6_41370 [Streptomyces sp. NPDC059037]|uniref:hypothetical protein n=1 Tax=Streptomyces sp. NPDC059037 TaxID=3346710 RepID=UPI0036C07D3B
MDFAAPLDGIEVCAAGDLLSRYAGSGPCTPVRWQQVLDGLAADRQGVIPRQAPAADTTERVTFLLDHDPLGPLLGAVARLLHEGDEAAARDTAHAARSFHAVTTAPPLRHHRRPAPAPGADVRTRFMYRVATEGQHYLPLTAGELRDELGAMVPRQAVVPRPVPEERAAWVVVWETLSAPGVVMTGAWAAVAYPDATGIEWLMQSLKSGVAAMEPGPPDLEWRRP